MPNPLLPFTSVQESVSPQAPVNGVVWDVMTPGKRVFRWQPRRSTVRSLDMRLACILSILMHVAFPVLFLIVSVLVMLLLGIDLSELFARPEPKTPDIEFVLSPQEYTEKPPLDPNTRFRADKNMQAGGEHRPDQPVHVAQPARSAPPSVAQAPTPPVQAAPTPAVKPPSPKLPERLRNPNITKRYVLSPTTPMAKPISVPKISSPAPLPTVTPAAATGSTAATLASLPGAAGSLANGQAGNKNGTLGVDALREPNFGPYMRELQRRIKRSWHPPRGNESKQVVVVFRINRQGQLVQSQVSKSSGEPLADQAALAAIQQVFPFRALPPEYADEVIDIEFTFDYNVFGTKQGLDSSG